MKIKVLSIEEGQALISLLQERGENVYPEVEQDTEGMLWVNTSKKAN